MMILKIFWHVRIVQKNFQCILFPALLELIPHDGHNDYTDFGLII